MRVVKHPAERFIDRFLGGKSKWLRMRVRASAADVFVELAPWFDELARAAEQRGYERAMAEALADADPVVERIAADYAAGWNAHRAALEAVAERAEVSRSERDPYGTAQTIRRALEEVEQ